MLGEIVPKSVYQQKSDLLAPVLIYPLRGFSYLFYPVVFVFSRIARLCARVLGGSKAEQAMFMTREQIRSVVEMSDMTSNLDAFDRGRIRRVIRQRWQKARGYRDSPPPVPDRCGRGGR